jgi:hypothetical protein
VTDAGGESLQGQTSSASGRHRGRPLALKSCRTVRRIESEGHGAVLQFCQGRRAWCGEMVGAETPGVQGDRIEERAHRLAVDLRETPLTAL